jgi:hypothetical protein
MIDASKLEEKILSNNYDFETLALDIFFFQYKNNKIYRQFVDLSKIKIDDVKNMRQIPFLPIQFFKTHPVYVGSRQPDFYFESSGTTQTINSKHYIQNLKLYENIFAAGFKSFYGNVENYNIIALLPNYLERSHSSLVYMFDALIRQSKSAYSGFYLYDFEKLNVILSQVLKDKRKTLLLGVTFALLDFAEQYPQDLRHCIVMETGGMKGRKREMTRQEVHQILKQAFNIPAVHAEYGMTELLSQAYSAQDGIYTCSHSMSVLCRDIYNPKAILPHGERGLLNIIDIGNLYSCSFIATQDAGITHADNCFEISGRMDNSELRGCNLMVG